jgi:ankyrin repeat protein
MNFAHRRHILKGIACALCLPAAAQAGAYDDFFRAVNVDNASGARAVLERGLDPNVRSEQGQHALYLAIRDESPRILALLWTWPGVDVNARNAAGETPLMMAALKGNLPVMEKLLSLGVPAHHDGWSPLHYAATGKSTEAVALLLDRGAPVDALSPNLSTPLMMAARYGTEASVELLVRRGADLAHGNDRGQTATDFAQMADRDWMLRKLRALQLQQR